MTERFEWLSSCLRAAAVPTRPRAWLVNHGDQRGSKKKQRACANYYVRRYIPWHITLDCYSCLPPPHRRPRPNPTSRVDGVRALLPAPPYRYSPVTCHYSALYSMLACHYIAVESTELLTDGALLNDRNQGATQSLCSHCNAVRVQLLPHPG